jgi:hypothetical protein
MSWETRVALRERLGVKGVTRLAGAKCAAEHQA